MIDSGCSDHMSNNLSDFENYIPLSNPRLITLGDLKTTISYHGTGTVRGWTYVNDRSQEIILSNVLHTPDLRGRFLSTRRLDEKGYSTLFQNSEATICKNDRIIGIGKLQSQ
jgi:hypothetical protein